MGKHTPGPWVAVDDEIVSSRDEQRIADVPLCDGIDPTEWQANMRLIAAAPDLFEALMELVEVLRREAPGTALNNHKFDALGIKANNAIAKVESR